VLTGLYCYSGKRKEFLWCFNQWAQTTLGNKFDRQFAMQGRVQAERMVRVTMSQKR
jgi:hypothetical protein